MAASPLTFADLPSTLPVFPLTGALLLPGGELPLNIFEPRYLAMFDAAMATPHRLIGMVQARPESGEMGSAPIYNVGCAGRISSFSETDDGRYLVSLSGLIRFDILEELPLAADGYRQVQADFLSYDDDLALEPGKCCAPERRAAFIAAMRAYFKAQGFDTDWQTVEAIPIDNLATSLAMACPFSPAEKQAMLEAPERKDMIRTLQGLLTMGAMAASDGRH